MDRESTRFPPGAPGRSAPARAVLPGLVAALGVVLGACRGELDDLRPVLDLARELPVAEVHHEVASIDLGTPAARRHLLGGWSWDEEEPGGTSFVWGVGSASRLRFFLAEPRRLRIGLRGRPYASPPEHRPVDPQTVRVRVSGRELARLELAPEGGWTAHRVDVPAEALRSGWNVVELEYAWSVSPREAGVSDDRRRLAVAWDAVRLEPAGAPQGEPSAAGGPEGGDVVRLPAGSEVAYYLHLEPGSVLALDRIEPRGGAPGRDLRLVVEVRAEGADPREVARLRPASGRRSVPLACEDADGRELVRLALRAVPVDWPEPGERTASSGELALAAPRVLGPGTGEPNTPPVPRRAAPGSQPGAVRDRSGPEPARRPHVLVYLVDTLRADRVGAYGGVGRQRGLTPVTDAFAAGATLFEAARTEAPWTRPVVASLFTGRGPLAHGVTTLDDRLAEEAVTLAEALRRAGYRTAAWSTNWHVTRETGLAQGFDAFHFFPKGPRADVVNRSVARWLDRELARREAPGRSRTEAGARADANPGPTGTGPLFLYVHALDPHAPYRPPEALWRRHAPHVTDPAAGSREHLRRAYAASGRERARLVDDLRPLYDAETALADRCFGELLAILESRGLRKDTLVVFLSDHGEEFDEHGDLGHGNNLYDESLRAPLIVDLPGDRRRGPGEAGVRRGGPASPKDVPATILASLDLPGLPEMEGRDLFDSGRDAPRPVFAHLDYEGRRGVAVVLGDWKLIVPRTGALGRSPELYHLGRDPAERRDLAAERPVRAGYLESLIRRRLLVTGDAAAAERLEASPELRKGLEALGYL